MKRIKSKKILKCRVPNCKDKRDGRSQSRMMCTEHNRMVKMFGYVNYTPAGI